MAKPKLRERPISRTHTPSRWRSVLILGAIGLTLLAGIGTWLFLQKSVPVSFAAQQSEGPHLAVDKELIDFGPVPFGRMVSARFRVRNVGDLPLRLAVDPRVEAIEGC